MRLRNPSPGSDPVDRRRPSPARTPIEVVTEAALVVPNAGKLVVRLLRDPRVPFREKAFAGFVVAYVMSPVDVIPDVIPGIGHLDDVLLVALAVDRLVASVDEVVVAGAWDGSEDALDLFRSFVAWGADLVRSVVPSPRWMHRGR